MTNDKHSVAETAAIGGAYMGYQVYRATGDSRLAARTGIKSAGLLWLCGILGAGCFFALIGVLGSVFFTDSLNGDQGVDLGGAFMFLVVAVLAAGLVLVLYRNHKVMMNRAVSNQGQIPTIPGEALPPTAPRPDLPAPSQQYTYDLRTGKFIKHW